MYVLLYLRRHNSSETHEGRLQWGWEDKKRCVTVVYVYYINQIYALQFNESEGKKEAMKHY